WLGHLPSRADDSDDFLQALRLESMGPADLIAVLGTDMDEADAPIRRRIFDALCAIGASLWTRGGLAPIVGSEVLRRRPVASFDYSNGEVEWAAPRDGYYYIVAFGAKAGDGPQHAGGRGAIVGGGFFLQAGQALCILAGGMSTRALHCAPTGGGGASFVTTSGAWGNGSWDGILVVAGGGGGCGEEGDGCDAKPATISKRGGSPVRMPGQDGCAVGNAIRGARSVVANVFRGAGSAVAHAIRATGSPDAGDHGGSPSAAEALEPGAMLGSVRLQTAMSMSMSAAAHSTWARGVREAELMRGLSLGRLDSGPGSPGGFGGGGSAGRAGGGGGGGFTGGEGSEDSRGGGGGESYVHRRAAKQVARVGNTGSGRVDVWWGLYPPIILNN
ncbi:unnamed protein product, partial [Ostreobium quekettii]